MKGLGYVIGVAAVGIADIGIAIQGLSLLWTGVDWGFAIDQFREFGRDTVRGLVEGIKSMYELPVKAIMGLGAATVEAFKLVLGIHSPSKVFEQLGAYTAEGYAVGLDGSQARVDQSITGMVRVPSKGGAAGGTPTINLTVQVDATGNDADAIARKLADLLPGQLASAFEELALEGGTA
jgi:hypothetical protein